MLACFLIFRRPCVVFLQQKDVVQVLRIFVASVSVALIGEKQWHTTNPCRKKKGAGNVSIHFIPGHCLHTALELAVHTSHKHCGGGHNQFVSWPPVSESSLSSA